MQAHVKNHSQKPERVDRLGLIFGTLAAVFWPFSLCYDFAQAGTIIFNMLACVFLWRSGKGVAVGSFCLFLTLMGLMLTFSIPRVDGVLSLQPLAFASGFSTFFMIILFSSLGGKKAGERAPGSNRESYQRASVKQQTPMTPNLWSLLFLVCGISLIILGATTSIELLVFLALPLLLAAPLAFAYGEFSGVSREVRRKAKTSDDLDGQFPST